MSALFEICDYQQPTHACAGDVCQVCANTRNGEQAKALGTGLVKKDPRWAHEATQFIDQLAPGALFTADDLVQVIGLPDGHQNQVGALVRSWAAADRTVRHGYETSKRQSNHGRVVSVWRKVK